MTVELDEKTPTRRIVTTDELIEMLARGDRVYLPAATLADESARAHYSPDDLGRLDIEATENDIVSVEYVRDDEVQCIEVADERHLYLTDDFIPTHNTSNIVFLKSTDDVMIETLEKMSGKTHKSYIDSKQVTRDLEKIALRNEGRVTYTMNTKEEPLISFNDMAFIPERNSVVFRAGDAPVWNRNETILPMSYRLFKNKITHPGHDYTLQTIPTMSTAKDFDVRTNQPNFVEMLKVRMLQAERAQAAKDLYARAYEYSDFDVARLDPDIYSDEVMEIIDMQAAADLGRGDDDALTLDPEDLAAAFMSDDDDYIENIELQTELAERSIAANEMRKPLYAEGLISRDMLINPDGSARPGLLDAEIAAAYKAVTRELEMDTRHFSVGGDSELRSADGRFTYIETVHSKAWAKTLADLQGKAADPDSRVYAEDEISEGDLRNVATVKIHAEFYTYLASLASWENLAGGEFERVMAIEMRRR